MSPPPTLAEVEQACRADPGNARLHRERARLLLSARRAPEAIAAAARAVDIDPGDNESWYVAFLTRLRAGHASEIVRVCREWSERHPDQPLPRHMLAAYGGAPPPPRAGDDFVRQLFDAFAPTFDAALDRLEYQAPLLCGQLLSEHLAAHGRSAAEWILDAGCGTGLGASVLGPLARHRVGVDLSPAMLAKAREKGLYDTLEEAELTAWLAAGGRLFDAILLSDVLVYFGELGTLLPAAAARLTPEGCLVGTCELAPDGVAEWKLMPSGRFAHAADYLVDSLRAAGLADIRLEQADLRLESAAPVRGLIFSAARADS